MSDERLRRHLEQLLRDRRPRRFAATDDEAAQLQAAARLRAAHPGADLPTQEFIDGLGERLRRHAGQEQRTDGGRRRFLRSAGLAVAAASAGVAVDRIAMYEGDRSSRQDTPQTLDHLADGGAWARVGSLAALAPAGMQRFSAGGVEGVLVRQGETVTAMSAACTHMGCLLTPDPAARLLRCPCHTATFDMSGMSATPDYYLPPLPRVQSRLTGDDIEVLVPRTA